MNIKERKVHYKNRISDVNYNTFMGYNAGREVSTGNHNTFLGNHAGYGVDGSDADNNVAIGSFVLFSSDAQETFNSEVFSWKSRLGFG